MRKTITFLRQKLLVASLIFFCINAFANEEEEEAFTKATEYTINYNNVSALEYIQFVSKVCDINFIYKNEDLNFNVTVISQEPITKESVMSTLIQILRVHSLFITEDEGTLIISKTEDVKEVAPLVSAEQKDIKDPIVTRIFPVENTSPETLSTIIRPMISKNAILEVLSETRLLIVTDVTTNVRKIATLIENLDSKENPLVIESYSIQTNTSKSLIDLTKKIMQPLIGGNPFILVAQDSTRNIFVVSTPALVKKTMKVLEGLDMPAQAELKTHENQQVFIYTPVNRTQKDLKKSLLDIADSLKEEGDHHPALVDAIESMKWLPETNSFVFSASEGTIVKLQSILKSIDTPLEKDKMVHPTYFLYKLKHASGEQMKTELSSLVEDFKSQKVQNPKLIYVLENAKWVKETNSILLTGDPRALEEAKTIIAQYDTPSKEKGLQHSYFLYKLKYVSGEQIEEDLEALAAKFRSQKIEDPKLLQVIDNAKWVKETNSILLTGDPTAIDEVKNIISQYDTPKKAKQPKGNFYIYSPKYASLDDVYDYLSNVANNLKSSGLTDLELINTINTMKKVPSNNSIIFTGNDKTLEKVKKLLASYDISKEGELKGNFLMFTPKHVSLENMVESVKEIAGNLKSSGLADQPLLQAINSMRTSTSTNSLIFTGDNETLKKIQTLLSSIDLPMSKQAIQHLGKASFWVYKIKNASPQQLITSIKSISTDLSKLESTDPQFLKALKSIRYVKETNSLVFTGTQEALERIEPLVEKFDIPFEKKDIESTYYVYKPQYLTGPELEKVLHDFAENLKVSNLENSALFEAIESMKWSEQTQTLVFTGEVTAIDEIKQLLQTFDVPDKAHPNTQEISGLEDLGFLVYKLQYHKGDEIQQALKQISRDLIAVKGKDASKFKLVTAIEAIQWIQVTNSLLCSGDKETLAKLKELISNLDVPLKQVFIEVLVIQTTLTNALSFGLDWGTKFQYKDKAAMGMGNFSTPTTGTNAFASTLNSITNTKTPTSTDIALGNGFDLGIVGDILFHKGRSFLSLGTLLSALQDDTETSIVMTPKIIAQDGKTASIFSGQNIPYSGSVVTNQGASTLVTTNLEYRDIGMGLTITPILGNSDSVTLSILLESSINPAGGTTVTQLGQVTGITTNKTTMTTSVHVANKNFLVLSGMVTDEKVRSKSGIPCLGGLPLIGAAFSKNNSQKTKDNIVIFLRPHIINSYRDMVHLTQTQEDSFREQQGTPTLERDYDESTELMKSFEDE